MPYCAVRMLRVLHVEMESARRQRDKAYRHLFKGSVLVSTLLEQDKERFDSREEAVRFGQRLLDGGHVQSIVGSKVFDDSVQLYRWTDDSIVEEAKKLVSSTSSNHIPKKRLTELINFQKEANDGGETLVSKQNKRNRAEQPVLSRARSTSPSQTTSFNESRTRSQNRIRSTRASKPVTSCQERNKCTSKDRGTAKRCRSFDSTSGSVKDNNNSNNAGRRSSSVPNANSGEKKSLRKEPSTPVQRSPQTFKIELSRNKPSKPAQEKKILEKTDEKPPSAPNQQVINDFTFHRSPQHVKIELKSTTSAKSVRNPQHTSIDFVSFVDFQMTPPVNPEQGKELHCNATSNDVTSTDESPANQSNDDGNARESRSPVDHDVISTCRYDGVEMPALDLDNLDFDSMRPTTEKMAKDSLAVMQRSVDTLTEQSHGYSDNEKVLLEEMKAMQTEHQKLIDFYEKKIDSLMNSINYIKDAVKSPTPGKGRSVAPPGGKTDAEKTADQNQRSSEHEADDADLQASTKLTPLSTAPHSPSNRALTPVTTSPAPPPVPPPPPPLLPSQISKVLRPTKPSIKPRVKMRPLFWNRIILDNKRQDQPNFWRNATEPNFDVSEFEKLFGRKSDSRTKEKASLHESLTPSKGPVKVQAAKILDDKRSKAVGIKMRSLHCTLDDIKHAVYSLDFSKVDVDSLQSLAEMRGTDDELSKIRQHLKEHPSVSLDKPEEFIWELSKLSYFPERAKCFALKKRFSETLFNIDQQLGTVDNACAELSKSDGVRRILELVLAFGNYMNGGTQRGQADGFDLNILVKLKDVKAMDNSTTLLHFIVRQHCKENEENVGRKAAQFPLPDQSLMTSAAATSFVELGNDLRQLKRELSQYSKKAEEIYMNSENGIQQPFKEQMDDFFDSAEHMLEDQQTKVDETEKTFHDLLKYLLFVTKDEVMPNVFFSMWATFLDDYKRCWKEEQKRLAREMFEKIEEKRRERMRMVKRRRSMPLPDDHNNNCSSGGNNNSGGGGGGGNGNANGINLKQKFKAIRRKSEMTARLFRSQSVHNLNDVREEDWNDTRTTRSLRDYPSNSSTPSPSALRSSDAPSLRADPSSPEGVPGPDQDDVFSHAQDDRCRERGDAGKSSSDRNKLMSTFQLNLKKELKPTVTVTNPITNSPEQVTLRRDWKVARSDDAPLSVHARLRERWNRMSGEGQSPNADEKQERNGVGSKGRLDREKPLTRPKSSANLEDLKLLSGLKSPREPMKVDYKTDFVPGKLQPSKMFPFQSTPLSRARHLRSAENLTTDEDSTGKPGPQTTAASLDNSPVRCGSVERLSMNFNSGKMASRSHFEQSPCDVAPSGSGHIETWRKLSRAGTQSNSSAR